jgi:hypothetical protein
MTQSASLPAQWFAFPGIAFDSWIATGICRHRAAKTAGAEVNPPIPSTTSGLNLPHSPQLAFVARANRQQKRINWRDVL